MSECHDVYDLEGWPTGAGIMPHEAGSEPWTVSLTWRQEGPFLYADATLLGEGLVLEARGDARRGTDAGASAKLAAARALVNLSRSLVEQADHVTVEV